MDKKNNNIQPRNIVTEMQDSYLDYAMSVIVTRALPDVRDGLKPVHRRILYAMKELGLSHNAKFRKSATVVGEVLGKYHPHGDIPVYDSLVRMAQTFSYRYPLVIGQGNFGSIDGDSPAAMRYTEAKMAAISEFLLTDIEKNTVDFVPNYDNTRKEPVLIPAAFPNILVNGTLGIAVGMSTTILPHNLSEVVSGTIHLIDNPNAKISELMNFIKAPDFPTGGIIYNLKDVRATYETGRGGVVVRGEAEIVENKNSYQIIISSIPYQVNKSEMISKIAGLVQDKKIEGIRDLRDESDREGLRIAIDLKNDSFPQKILNYIYKHTDLEKTFHSNMLALVDGIQPKTLSLKEILEEFIKSRIIIIQRSTKFDLEVAKRRVHILEGLSKALSHIEKIIKIIKSSKDKEYARTALKKNFRFSEAQTTAILEMKLQTLAGLERKKIEDELKEKRALVKKLEALLKSPAKIKSLIKNELGNIKEKFNEDRRTKIIRSAAQSISIEDIIPEEEHIMLLTEGGYLKRIKPQAYRSQRRGGKGVEGGVKEDIVLKFVSASTHDDLLFFSSKGKAYLTKMYEIPEGSRTARGKSIMNFLSLRPDEKITSVLALPKNEKDGESLSLLMATKKGIIKKTTREAFKEVRKSGIIAIDLKKDDELIWAKAIAKKDEIMMFSKKGIVIRFPEAEIRLMGRSAIGVRGINLKKNDTLVDCAVVKKDPKVTEAFVISSNGFGKRTKLKEFKVQKRGGAGIKVMNVSEKTGDLVNASLVYGDEEFIAISEHGKTIRTSVKEIPLLRRVTQGVRIMKLASDDNIASMTLL